MQVAGLKQALKLEYVSLLWMAIEFGVGLQAGLQAHSILLVAFGLDSLLEIFSGGVLIWRLHKQQRTNDEQEIERIEQLATRLVGGVLLLLAVYVVLTAGWNLWQHQAADLSWSGLTLSVLSLILMPILAVAKRRLGRQLHSAALVEDGMCNITCAYMAGTVLIGALLTALFGWWWADSVAALVLVYFIVREGLEGLRGDTD
jgi:divalent metal cation (Fe/Co/Zn/Cd) transporter